jgi:Helitron helicase-like domain at N-terminus
MAAAHQATKHNPITDAAVNKKPFAMVGTIGSTAPASEERKLYELARMKPVTIRFGLPQIFITLILTDTNSPVALFYTGEKIDVKAFYPQLYSVAHRSQTILSNPLAVVKYFHNTINTIVKTLLKGGMFGELIHYQGPIELQGRGTPHTHPLVLPYSKNRRTDFLALDQGQRVSTSNLGQSQDESIFLSKDTGIRLTVLQSIYAEEVVDEGNSEPGSRHFQPTLPIILCSRPR